MYYVALILYITVAWHNSST